MVLGAAKDMSFTGKRGISAAICRMMETWEICQSRLFYESSIRAGLLLFLVILPAFRPLVSLTAAPEAAARCKVS